MNCKLLCASPPAHLNMPWLQVVGDGNGIVSVMQSRCHGPFEGLVLAGVTLDQQVGARSTCVHENTSTMMPPGQPR